MSAALRWDLQEALADQIRSVLDDVTDVAVQVEGWWVVNPTPPTIDIYAGDPSTDQELRAFGDPLGEPVFTIRARVGMTDSVEQQRLLTGFMDDQDPLSLAGALDEDPTLGGLATSVDVRAVTGLVYVREGGDYLGCIWTVVVTRATS